MVAGFQRLKALLIRGAKRGESSGDATRCRESTGGGASAQLGACGAHGLAYERLVVGQFNPTSPTGEHEQVFSRG